VPAFDGLKLPTNLYLPDDIGDKKLGYLYAYQNASLVRRRLLQAGVRLAGMLNALFDSPRPSIPDQPPVTKPPTP